MIGLKEFILNILEEAFQCLHFGINPGGALLFLGIKFPPEPNNLVINEMKYLEEEGQTFSKIGLKIATMCYGNDSVMAAIWKARSTLGFIAM